MKIDLQVKTKHPDPEPTPENGPKNETTKTKKSWQAAAEKTQAGIRPRITPKRVRIAIWNKGECYKTSQDMTQKPNKKSEASERSYD